MLNIIMQVQMLLAAISALLPFAPEQHQPRIQAILDLAATALAAAASTAANVDDLAVKLAAVRTEVEAMASRGERVSAAQLDAAMARVHAASAAFRAALETAEAGAN